MVYAKINIKIVLSLMTLSYLSLITQSCGSPEKDGNQVNDYPTQVVDEAAVSEIDETLAGFVEAGDIAGVSALVYEKGEEVYFNAFGYADRENQIPMDRNTIVKIYSMTKPITGVALMTLWEQDKFELDDSIGMYIPELANMQVYTGVDRKGSVMVEPANRPITVRDLTRHTAGFLNNNKVPGLSELLQQANVRSIENTLTQLAEELATVPLWFHPGQQWEYGLCVDMQALLVERISGQSFDNYIRAHVLDPLDMTETRYYVPEADRGRFAAAYFRSDNGQLDRTPDQEAHLFNFNHWPLKPGGYGLTATIDDYMRFARMLVNKGTLEGTTMLQPETVELMATNQLSDSVKERSFLARKGEVGFGIDFAVRLQPPATKDENFGVVGEYFWDGAASTLFWVDPTNELAAVLFVQLRPYDQIGLHRSFRKAVYSSINGR
jgi:CubicO group peptidase (beta-lactamase class C family)